MGNSREVFITVRVEESDYFRREGYDVHTTASISISQALLGGIIRISGLNEDINLRIPAGTSSHTAMTLSGRGIKHMESFNTFGDHIDNLVTDARAEGLDSRVCLHGKRYPGDSDRGR